MISTPIGMSIQTQMPMLYPQSVDSPNSPPTRTGFTRPEMSRPDLTYPFLTSPGVTHPIPTGMDQPDHQLNMNYSENIIQPESKIEQSELYADYLTNPYNEIKDVTKVATLYDPEDPKRPQDELQIQNPLISVLDKKSYSANTTPMHSTNKTQFGSSDNVRQESGIFNFSSYFGSVSEAIGPGSEVFDTLMSTQEG